MNKSMFGAGVVTVLLGATQIAAGVMIALDAQKEAEIIDFNKYLGTPYKEQKGDIAKALAKGALAGINIGVGEAVTEVGIGFIVQSFVKVQD